MPRAVIRLLNIALFAVCAFQVAQIANGVLGDSLRTADLPGAGLETPEPAAPVAWQERQVIVDRNLFGAQLDGGAQPAPIIDEDVEETRLPLSLVGTIAATGRSSRAAIYNTKSRSSQVLRPGDALEGHPQVTLDRVERGRVLLLNQGKREELLLAELDNAPQPAARPTRPTRRPARREARVNPRAPTAEQRAEAVRRASDRFRPPNDPDRVEHLEGLRERMLSGELTLDALGEEMEALQDEHGDIFLGEDDEDDEELPDDEGIDE